MTTKDGESDRSRVYITNQIRYAKNRIQLLEERLQNWKDTLEVLELAKQKWKEKQNSKEQ